MDSTVGSVTAQFEESLAELEVGLTRSDPAGFEAALESIVREPVVGVPLEFEPVSLPGWVDDRPTPSSLEAARTGITAASMGIADYGSVVLPESTDGAEQMSLFPGLHVPVLRARDLVPDMPTAIERLGPELRAGESAIIATGPSATADMGELVRGAHGPKDVHVILLEDEGDDEGDSAARGGGRE